MGNSPAGNHEHTQEVPPTGGKKKTHVVEDRHSKEVPPTGGKKKAQVVKDRHSKEVLPTAGKKKIQGAEVVEDSSGVTKVLLAATELFQVMGSHAYHTSVIVGSRELFFDGGGVVEARAFWSHAWCQGCQEKFDSQSIVDTTEVVEMGSTTLSTKEVIKALGAHFQVGSYDVLRKNCNTFTDAAIYLLTGQRLGVKFNRLERWVMALEPVSTDILRMIMRQTNKTEETLQDKAVDVQSEETQELTSHGYVANPQSESFNVEDVIAFIDGPDNRRVKASPDALSSAWCSRSYACCGKLESLPAAEPLVQSVWDPVIEQSSAVQPWDPFGRSGDQHPGVQRIVPMVGVYDEKPELCSFQFQEAEQEMPRERTDIDEGDTELISLEPATSVS